MKHVGVKKLVLDVLEKLAEITKGLHVGREKNHSWSDPWETLTIKSHKAEKKPGKETEMKWCVKQDKIQEDGRPDSCVNHLSFAAQRSTSPYQRDP